MGGVNIVCGFGKSWFSREKNLGTDKKQKIGGRGEKTEEA
jgi:hypothetical protein